VLTFGLLLFCLLFVQDISLWCRTGKQYATYIYIYLFILQVFVFTNIFKHDGISCLKVCERPRFKPAQYNRQNYSSEHLIHTFNKCRCIIIPYRTVHSAVCPDNCHSQNISLRMKFCQGWPQYTEKTFRTMDHHWQQTTYLSQFVAIVSTTAVCQRTKTGHNTRCLLENIQRNVSANRQPHH